jgi:glycosyltransferase involved in cell wall biosynthesis
MTCRSACEYRNRQQRAGYDVTAAVSLADRGAVTAGAPVLAFVGAFPDPAARPDDPAYSPAGELMQQRLIRALRDAGLDVDHIFALRTALSFPRGKRLVYGSAASATPDGVPVSFIPFINVPPLKQLISGILLVPLLLRWALRNRGRPRAVLLYNVACPPGVFSVIAGRLTGSRTCAVVADLQVPGSGYVGSSLMRRADYRLQTSTLRLFDGLIVLTESMATDYAPAVPSLQMEGAVPPELERAAPTRTDSHDGSAPFTIMYAGELSELKGVPLLLEAFARLEGANYRCWISGKGELQQVVESAARSDDRITYWGFPSYAKVLELYGRADVLVNPHSTTHASARYLFPSKLIEYLATGRPVISTLSTPEVEREYGDCTVLLDSASAPALASALVRLAEMPAHERHRIGEAGRRLVLQRKTWAAQGQRIADLIRAGMPAALPAARG